MPNKGGPKDSTRRLINSVMHSQMLYASPILISALNGLYLKKQLHKPQRISALRVISGYRTISTSAALVLGGIPPIDLLIQEREEIWRKLKFEPNLSNDNSFKELVKKEARETLIHRWQVRWEGDQKGRWTFRLIPNIKNWIQRIHGEMNYYLTQFMTGHGKFNSYLHRFKIRESSHCDYCGSLEDNVEHAIFSCRKWESIRNTLNEEVGLVLTPENIVQEMLQSERSWKDCQTYIFRIMKHRSSTNSEPLSSHEDGGVGHTQ